MSLWFVFLSPGLAADWLHWRGPEQTGASSDTGMPAKWSPDGENLIWKKPFSARSTPIVSKGRVYIINGAGQGITEQERVMCFDAKSGDVLWEHKFNIFHSDIVTNRVGWANLAADPETGNIYAHGVQGLFFCFNADGKILWSKSLTEEYGRISGYGGRIGSPFVDGELVIINMLNSSWGDQGRGGHRFLAMNKKTGDVVWWSEPGGQPLDTIYSNPVIATVNGQRLLICGNADGGIYAIKVHTGEKVWGYVFSKRGINVSPVVAGNRVYITHSEENFDTTTQGAVICLDASKVTNGQPEVVWRQTGILAGYASPLLHNGRLYVCDNSAKMFCLDAESGKTLWTHKYGTVAKGSPVWADGKIYIGEVTSRFHILEPSEGSCKTLHTIDFPKGPQGEVFELNGSAAIADGKLYFATGEGIYCIGTREGKAGNSREKQREAKGGAAKGEPAWVQVTPADVVLSPGGSTSFQVRLFNANGELIKESDAEWSLPPFQPPTPPGSKAPPRTVPPLKGTIEGGKLAVAKDAPAQAGSVQAKVGNLVGKARVRVAPQIPITQDFDKVPDGAIPGGWINVAGKFRVEKKNGTSVLKKLATNPNLARANAYIGMPNLTNYTIEADIMGGKAKRFYPEMGVINCRYSLVADGNKDRLLLRSWEANHRLEKRLPVKFKENVWYRFKLKVTVEGEKGICQGKIWARDDKEPEAWTIEIEDPIPNREGSPALFAYAYGIPNDLELAEKSPGAEIFYDNVKVYPNK